MATDASDRLRRLGEALHRGRHRFRRWRRSRPFWGGLLLLLGGIQLFLSTQMSLIDLEISFGPEGFLVVLLPAVLLLCGALVWITPQHRFFYSIIGTLTAVYSLLGLNLGGWFLGMLLGVIGGALGFAWTPTAPRPAEIPATADDPPSAETAELPPATGDGPIWEGRTGPLTDETPGQDQTAPFRAPRRDPPAYVALVVPLLLTIAMAAPTVLPSQICLPLLCPDPSPSPSPAPTPTPTPTGDAEPEPEPEPEPGEEPDPTSTPGRTATPAPTPTPTRAPTPSQSPTPIPTLDPPPGQPLVAAEPALLTADRLVLQDFRFEGVTELPTAEGPVEVMQLSFSRGTNINFSLTTTGGGGTAVVTADPLVLAGDVTFFTNRFQARVLGVLPLTLTPDSPLVDLLELVGLPLPVFFTDVELDLVFTQGAELTADGFLLSVS